MAYMQQLQENNSFKRRIRAINVADLCLSPNALKIINGSLRRLEPPPQRPRLAGRPTRANPQHV